MLSSSGWNGSSHETWVAVEDAYLFDRLMMIHHSAQMLPEYGCSGEWHVNEYVMVYIY